MSSHPICHVDFSANDSAAAGQFYSEVFGWKTQQPPGFEGYTMFQAGDGPGGGFAQVGENTQVGTVTVYVATDDINASLAKIEANGGKTVMPKSPIPGIGSMALFTDPTGNTVGLFSEEQG
jgi:predicted enzyme related to lactoylglutathione lyase